MKKNYFRVLKLSVLTVLLLSFVSTVKAQTFICTDASFYWQNWSAQKIQKKKGEILGSKAFIIFYDNSLKVSFTDNEGSTSTFVLDKINDKEYQYSISRPNNKRGNMKLKLEKWVSYIKSFTIEISENYSIKATATYKRD